MSHQLSGIRGGDVVNCIFSLIVGSSPLLAVLWRCQDTKSRLAIFNTEIKFCPLCILSDLIISVLIDIIYRHLLHIKYFKWVIVCASPTENGYIQVLAFSFFAGQSFLEILWIRFSSKCYSHTDLFIKKNYTCSQPLLLPFYKSMSSPSDVLCSNCVVAAGTQMAHTPNTRHMIPLCQLKEGDLVCRNWK